MMIRFALAQAVASVESLRDALVRLAATPTDAHHDIGWLRLRCEDTLAYRVDLQLASMKQLLVDLAAFDGEFPGLLPPDLRQRCAQALGAALDERRGSHALVSGAP